MKPLGNWPNGTRGFMQKLLADDVTAMINLKQPEVFLSLCVSADKTYRARNHNIASGQASSVKKLATSGTANPDYKAIYMRFRSMQTSAKIPKMISITNIAHKKAPNRYSTPSGFISTEILFNKKMTTNCSDD